MRRVCQTFSVDGFVVVKLRKLLAVYVVIISLFISDKETLNDYCRIQVYFLIDLVPDCIG